MIRAGYNILFVIVSVCVFWGEAGHCLASTRTALVIGNGGYQSAPLRNPVNDANDIARLLEKLDFDVIKVIDANRREMLEAVNTFSSKLKRSDIGLFYFAGHGMQINGTNYLLPVEINVVDESDVEFEAVRADRVVAKMRNAETNLNVVILDACRNNPFKRSFRTAARGLARMDAPKGTIIAYATSPGSVAADGEGRNGVYTEKLLQYMATPGLDIQDVFNEAGMKVMEATEDVQIPWTSITPIPKYYLAGMVPLSSGMGPSSAKPASGSLKVISTPSGADVSIGGKRVGTTPLIIDELSAGDISLGVTKSGFVSEERETRIKSGRRVVVTFSLQKEKSTGWLTVHTTPENAVVRFINYNEPYHPDMKLEAGRYQLEVAAEGYQSRQKWVEITNGDDLIVEIALQQMQHTQRNGWLTVKTIPQNAQVRILNIRDKYRPDMKLLEGSYHLEVSAPGYAMQKKWVEIENGDDLTIEIRLKQLSPKPAVAVREQPMPAKKAEPEDQEPPASPVSGPYGAVYQEPITGMEFVYVPKGCFEMGDVFNEGNSNEKPVHRVCVDSFYIGKFEVTQAEYQQITGLNPSRFKGNLRLPVERVSWDNVLRFIDKFNRKSTHRYRLPSEAEWEYAAREGGRKIRFGFGKDTIDDKDANFDARESSLLAYLDGGIFFDKTVPVGSFEPNALGLYDMSGNVWELCLDMYSSSYYSSGSSQNNPVYRKSMIGDWDPLYQVIRGGGFNSTADSLRVTQREKFRARAQYEKEDGIGRSNLGFRLVFPVNH